MTVRPTHLGELLPVQTQAATGAHANRTGGAAAGAQTAFAKALAGASAGHANASKTHTSTPAATMQAEAKSKTKAEIDLHKGEAMHQVAGRAFAEIDGGKRDGLYINTSDNARHGQTFTMTVRKGREFHIYGTGEDRVVVSMPVKHDRATTDTTSAATTGGATPTVKAS